MKKFNVSVLIILFFGLFIVGCEKRELGSPADIHWDRDSCERCAMVISDRKYASEIINPKSGKLHKFDNIAGAILWLDENKISWKDEAILWVKDAKNEKWINAREAFYTTGNITPMSYGLAAYASKENLEGKSFLNFQEAIEEIYKVEKFNTKVVQKMEIK